MYFHADLLYIFKLFLLFSWKATFIISFSLFLKISPGFEVFILKTGFHQSYFTTSYTISTTLLNSSLIISRYRVLLTIQSYFLYLQIVALILVSIIVSEIYLIWLGIRFTQILIQSFLLCPIYGTLFADLDK